MVHPGQAPGFLLSVRPGAFSRRGQPGATPDAVAARRLGYDEESIRSLETTGGLFYVARMPLLPGVLVAPMPKNAKAGGTEFPVDAQKLLSLGWSSEQVRWLWTRQALKSVAAAGVGPPTSGKHFVPYRGLRCGPLEPT